MKVKIFFVVIIFFFFLYTLVNGQEIVPNRIIVQFKQDVVLLPDSAEFVKIDRKTINDIDLFNLLKEIKAEKLIKLFPHAVVNKTFEKSSITNEWVQIKDLSQYFILNFKKDLNVTAVSEKLLKLPNVISAEPDYFPVIDFIPNDPHYSYQWYLKNNVNSKFDINIEPAWDYSKGENIKVGIIEYGVRYTHEDLYDHIWTGPGSELWYGVSSPEERHGTYVSGIVGAIIDNSKGISGVAGNSILMPRKGYTAAERASDINDVSFYGARVINNSWHITYDASYLRSAVQNAFNRGAVIVASMGNKHNQNEPDYVAYPAAYNDWVLACGALKKVNNGDTLYVRPDQNKGSFIDLALPGDSLLTTSPYSDNGYLYFGMTSAAAPVASGISTLLFCVNNNLTNVEVMNIMKKTSRLFSGWEQEPNSYGNGLPDTYQAILLGMSYENKSTYSAATFANNARHLLKDNGYLYEIFMSGNEIFFRRSNNNGSSWQVTKRLSGGNGSNSRPAISAFYDNSLHAVWQRKVGTNLWDIYYTYSADNGSSWSTPSVLAHNVQTTGSQNNGAQPVIAYCFVDEMYMELMTVYVSSSGIKYHTKTNATGAWSSASTLSGSYNSTTRFPSLSGGESYFTLVYDTRYYGVYSRTYDGSWTSETRVDWEGYYDRETCAAKEKQGGDMLAAFIARPSYSAPYSLYFRRGYSNNTWSSFKKRFDEVNGKDYRRPSLTYFDANYTNQFAVSILSHTSANRVVMHKYYAQYDNWSESDIAYDGREPSITGYDYASPKYCWTDQSDMPYLIKLSSNNLPKNSQSNDYNEIYARSAVIANGLDGSAQILEVSDYVVRTKSGKEYRIAFHKYPDDTLKLNLDNVWDYMDSEPVKLPADASELTYNKKIYTVFPNDSSGRQSGVSVFSAEEYRLAAVQAGTKSLLTVIDTQTKSGRVTADISSLAGKEIVLYPSLEIAVKDKAELHFEFTDIYYPLDKKLEKLHSVQESLAKEDKPSSFALAGNYPNPFNPSTTIAFSLPEEGEANLAVYDLSGRLVKVLIKERLTAGRHTVQWQGRNASGAMVASGVYIYCLRYNNRELAGKMLLLR